MAKNNQLSKSGTGILENTPNGLVRATATNAVAHLPTGEAQLITLATGLTIQKIVNSEQERTRFADRLVLCRLNWKAAKATMARMEVEAADIKKRLLELPDMPSLSTTEGGTLKAGQLIATVARQLNVHNNMDERQIDFAAADILTTYPKLRIEELAHILRGGIVGNYGKKDGFKLDVSVLHEWIKNYYFTKNAKIAEINNNAVRDNEIWQERREKWRGLK